MNEKQAVPIAGFGASVDPACRTQYHTSISNEIDRLQIVINGLDMLISDISGSDCVENEKTVIKEVESLSDFLKTGSDRLAEKNETMNRRIEELRNLLF